MITTIIEKYLSGIDQATFQKMMNHLLHLEGYKFIGSPGSVIGKNKTSKGSPDSFFEDGENYIFCEFTTQEKVSTGETFLQKLKSDIDHCFDVNKTKIDKCKISKVILAFTDELKPNEHNELKNKVKEQNPNADLVIYSIQQIPFRLVYYPGLADKYIPGVKTTKGALYTLPDFLKTTEKGLQPSLTNPFTGREDEIRQAKEYLLSNDILIITGSQGVGKSKLAVHLAEVFENEFAYEPRVIASSPVPLWEDLTSFILPANKYIIFFDDANKSLPNFDYLLQFVSSREKGSTKIMITVRDYIRQDLNKYLLNVPYKEITITPFEDKQITEIVNKVLPEGRSLDPIVLERIIAISKGNCRLALMATSSILQNDNISILNDVFSLYDQYFQKVKTEISFLEKRENMVALGILSFFGVLDRNDLEIKEVLEKHFSINWNDLWETIIELEKAELVDVFYKETAKISDQVLATYMFYKTFIDESSASIDYSTWLVVFIEKYEKKINKTLIDLINTFGFVELKDRITSLISVSQKKLESDSNCLYKFFEIFWFYREIDTLSFIKNWINNLKEETLELSDIKYSYETNDFVWASEYLKLLLNFWHHNTPFTKEAIGLSLKLMFRQPSRIPETLRHLKQNFSFHRFDYRFGYPRQLALMDILENGEFLDRERAITDQLLLSIAPSFLGWEYSQTESKGGGQMVIYNFALIKTAPLVKLRKIILEKLFALYNKNEFKVLEIINKYAWVSRSIDAGIYSEEQAMVTEFLLKHLSPKNYSHCKLIYEYVETLKEHNIEPLNDWNSFLNSDSMQIARIFNPEYDDEKFKFNEHEEKRKEDIKKFIMGKDIHFIETTFEQLNSIYKDASKTNDSFWIDFSLTYLFQSLAETECVVYYKSLELMMIGKYSFELNYSNIIFYPVRKKLVEPKELYKHLNRYEYKQKQNWKLMFFEALEEPEIDDFFLQEFIGYIFSVTNRFSICELDKYIKFDKQFNSSKSLLPPPAIDHKNIITYITEILLTKVLSCDITFDRHICEKCGSYFIEKVGLLKQIFYIQQKRDAHFDYNGKEMASISSLDHYFLVEYLNETTKDIDFIEFRFDKLNLSFLWDLPEYIDILDKALDVIIAKAPIFSNVEHQANVLFKGLRLSPEQLNRVYVYLSKFIAKHISSKQHIHIILNVVIYNFNDQILRFLKECLLLNKDIDFMNGLSLEKCGIISGSCVPSIEAHIKFLKSVIEMIETLPDPLDYTGHINHLEREIEWARKDKQFEMKRDFTGWME